MVRAMKIYIYCFQFLLKKYLKVFSFRINGLDVDALMFTGWDNYYIGNYINILFNSLINGYCNFGLYSGGEK